VGVDELRAVAQSAYVRAKVCELTPSEDIRTVPGEVNGRPRTVLDSLPQRGSMLTS